MFYSPKHLYRSRRRLPEAALALGLCLTMVLTTGAAARQQRVADKLVRLHILANSDSERDQAVKLRVRDDLLAHMEGQTELPALGDLQAWAEQSLRDQGQSIPVQVERTRMYFDTRAYDGFALPAGWYDAIRVILGEGAGRNWWCVLFPPLCAGACSGQLEQLALDNGMTPGDISFITKDGTRYLLRFRLAELFWGLCHDLQGAKN